MISQGGTHWTHWSIVLREALAKMGDEMLPSDGRQSPETEEGDDDKVEPRKYAGRRGLTNS